ncbi:uncharacterized protein [Onthophagus taurus]|uniref:uncharacterized protein n=1 Tax=Onthophagus taurus TaxID=166361 RepID=UPI0039BE6E2D
MPRSRIQNNDSLINKEENGWKVTTNKKSLSISKMKYSRLLRRDCKHNSYLNGFKTLRKQDDDFMKATPLFDDFITTLNNLNFDLPYPIVTPYIVEEEIDECAQIFKEKKKYRDKLKLYSNDFKFDQKYLTKVKVERSKYIKLPRYMIDLVAGHVKDPDEQFDGLYNWYYTGGILAKLTTNNDEEYLVCPLPNNNLKIIAINDYYNKIENIAIPNFNNDPILNLSISRNKENFLILRQRNLINVFSVLGNDNFSLLNIFKTSTQTKNPFLDVKQLSFKEIAYLDYNRKLTVTNLDYNSSKNYKFEKEKRELSDPFCQLEPIDENTLGFIDRNTLRFLDFRSYEEQATLDIDDKLFLCDDICYLTYLKDSPYLFIATVHNIKKIDFRTNKIVKTWAHMLTGQPSMLKIEKSVWDNLIYVSTQKYNERIVLNSNEEETNLVQLMPNNFDSFKYFNSIDFDLNYNRYENRLKFCTAGIEMNQKKKSISFYCCNTLGDIFQTNLINSSKRKSNDKDLGASHFKNWRESFERKINPCFGTHLRDLSNVKYILKKSIQVDALKRYEQPNRKLSRFIAEHTIEDTAFAHIWLDDENNTESETLAPIMSADNKVSNWLEGVKCDDGYDE